MRQLWPQVVDDLAPYDAYRLEDAGAPHLRLNMVQALDGRATDAAGVSGGLGGDGDFAVFVALRALADGILVGAGTARIEDYGPHRVRPSLAIRRRADGRTEPAPVVVVTRSAALDPAARLFAEARTPTVVLTCAAAPPERRRALSAVADVVVAGEDAVDLAEGLRRLREERGLAHLLCEGGPSLNADLLSAGLVDEVCVTIAPQLAAGHGPGIVEGLPGRVDLTLGRLLTDGEELLASYRVGRTGQAPAD
ncbi:MAG: dihydrofolate reductase family protein [Actinomycetota bacterium]